MKLQGLVKVCAAVLFCLGNQQLKAQQLKLGTNPSLTKQSAILELESKKQALLITRIADSNQIVSPVNGMIIYLESDNTFRVRANNYWNKLIADGAVKTINGDAAAVQNITAVNTAGTFGFNTTAGTHKLTIPDATTTAAGFMNLGAQSFKGLKTFTEGLYTKSLRVTDDVSTPTKLLGKDVNGDIASLTLDGNMSITAGQLNVANGTASWNANKLKSIDIDFTVAPTTNQVLTYDGTKWIAKNGATGTGTVTSVGLTMPGIFTVSGSPVTTSGTLAASLNPQAAKAVLVGPISGGLTTPTFRALEVTDLPDLSGSYIKNTTTTQATSNFNISGAGVIGTTLTVTGLGAAGSIPFTGSGGLISVNNAGLSWNNATPKLTVGGTMRLTGNIGTATTKILGRDNNGDISNVNLDATTLDFTTTAGTVAVKKGDAIWNASQLQGKAIASPLNPADGQVLKWNQASSTFVPAEDITGGTSYGDIPAPTDDISGATSTDPLFRMKIWKGSGKVSNGPNTGPTGAAAWSVLAFQNSSGGNQYTTHLYFDKNTLAMKEWGGGIPLTTNAGNGWYKVVTTAGDNIFDNGGILYASMTSDATSEVTQDYANFFWDKTNKRLGIKTNTPTANLDVNGTVKLGTDGDVFNSLIKDVATNTSKSVAKGIGFIVIPYTGAKVNGVVTVSPRTDPTTNVFMIGAASIRAANTITVQVYNTGTATNSTFNAISWDITIIQ
ncbi:beta strand repeat-containing protein [Chitinophaga arvensicola]|uniref:Uncharacterized protein n=1 Tax=Chitinophaga arvensicola TaxID=29529 RepID=A0A1I0QZP3_9BACT|nr:hypothetical protein [Chitinophaga arvensicola]SEW33200.1 hypothetical protein SAMN04488122_1940 [Chitinophaga arvensicola]